VAHGGAIRHTKLPVFLCAHSATVPNPLTRYVLFVEAIVGGKYIKLSRDREIYGRPSHAFSNSLDR